MVGEAASRFGRLDILVNCAGGWARARFEKAAANRPEHGSWDGAQLCRISLLQTPQCAAAFPTPAAGNFLSPAEQLSANGFRTVMEIDTFGTFHMCVMHAEEAHTGAVWALCLPLGVCERQRCRAWCRSNAGMSPGHKCFRKSKCAAQVPCRIRGAEEERGRGHHQHLHDPALRRHLVAEPRLRRQGGMGVAAARYSRLNCTLLWE